MLPVYPSQPTAGHWREGGRACVVKLNNAGGEQSWISDLDNSKTIISNNIDWISLEYSAQA